MPLMTHFKAKSDELDTNEGGSAQPFDSISEPPSNLPLDEATQILTLDEEQFRSFLSTLVKQRGFIADFAPVIGCSPQHLGALLSGKRKPGPRVLSKLGVSVETIYRVEILAGEGD